MDVDQNHESLAVAMLTALIVVAALCIMVQKGELGTLILLEICLRGLNLIFPSLKKPNVVAEVERKVRLNQRQAKTVEWPLQPHTSRGMDNVNDRTLSFKEVKEKLKSALPKKCGLKEILEVLEGDCRRNWVTAKTTVADVLYGRVVQKCIKDSLFLRKPGPILRKLIEEMPMDVWLLPKVFVIRSLDSLENFLEALLRTESFVYVNSQHDYTKFGGPPERVTFFIGAALYCLEMKSIGLFVTSLKSYFRLSKAVFVVWNEDCPQSIFRF